MLRASPNPLLFLIAFLAPAGCNSRADVHAEAQANQEAKEQRREVRLVAAKPHQFEDLVELSGALAADEQVTVSTKVSGRLASLEVDLASPVEAGQVVARVEATDYEFGLQQARAALGQARAQLGLKPGAESSDVDAETIAVVRQAQATLSEARANASRLEALTQEGLASQAELDTAHASLQRAEAGLAAAREQVHLWQAQVRQRQSEVGLAEQRVKDTAIRSPISGFVQTRRANVGEFLAAGAPIAEVVKTDTLRLRLAVPERDASRVAVGQRVRVKSESVTEQPEGSVARVAPGLDTDTRSLLIEADIENPGQLRPGNFVTASIVVGSRTAPSLPVSAIVTFAGLQKVMFVTDGKVVERTVTTGPREGDVVALTSGITVGEAVVEAPGSLQQGHEVQLAEPSPQSGP